MAENTEEFDNELFNHLVESQEDDITTEDISLFTEISEDDSDTNDDDQHSDDIYDQDLHDDNNNEPNLTHNELIESLLKSKGIENATVKYENEAGEIEDFNFYELPLEDQMSILNTPDEVVNNFDLDETEISAVNFLRENNVSLEEAIEYYKREAVKEYLDNENITGIQVDQYTDEELFALDLKSRYDDFDEDEIQIEINKQLEHPELFKKKIDKLRTQYKEIELNQLQQAKLEQEEKEGAVQTELQNSLISVAEGIEDIGGLDLDINDKNEVLSFILQKDLNGLSLLDKTLKDPNALFDIAWYATKGKEAFNILHDYYKKQIETVSKTSYEKAKADLAKTFVSPSKGKAFVRKTAATEKRNILSIDDLKID